MNLKILSGIIRPISKYIKHPKYNNATLENNLALIKVAKKFDIDPAGTVR